MTRAQLINEVIPIGLCAKGSGRPSVWVGHEDAKA